MDLIAETKAKPWADDRECAVCKKKTMMSTLVTFLSCDRHTGDGKGQKRRRHYSSIVPMANITSDNSPLDCSPHYPAP